jgi:hypothetical protein
MLGNPQFPRGRSRIDGYCLKIWTKLFRQMKSMIFKFGFLSVDSVKHSLIRVNPVHPWFLCSDGGTLILPSPLRHLGSAATSGADGI